MIKYGTGSCDGIYGNDFVSLPTSQMNISMSMMFVYNETQMSGMSADGIMGLSNDKSQKNIFEIAYSN